MAAVTTVIDADTVALRIGAKPDSEVVAAIESAIEGTSVFLESILNTEFKKTSRKDIFRVEKKRYMDEPADGKVRLHLKAGFVRATPAIVVKSAASHADLKAAVDVTTVDSADYDLDAVRGILYLDADAFDGLYVSVEYDSGFTGDSDSAIPNWLKEAALSYVQVVLNQSQTANRSDEVESIAKESGQHAMRVVGPYNRNLVPFTLYPLL